MVFEFHSYNSHRPNRAYYSNCNIAYFLRLVAEMVSGKEVEKLSFNTRAGF